MKRVWKAKEVIKSWEGKLIKVQMAEDPFDEDSEAGIRSLTIFASMLIIANNHSCETLEDSEKKRLLKEALKSSVKSGRIELDSAVHKWLKAASVRVSPRAWQDNAEEVHRIIEEGYMKENEPSKPKSKKTGEEEADAA